MTNKDIDIDFSEKIVLKVLTWDKNKIVWDDEKTKHICFGVDENFLPYAATTIVSIANVNKDINLVFHIVIDSVGLESETKISQIVDVYSNIEIVAHVISNDILAAFPQGNDWNLSIYYRAVAPLILQGRVQRLLYVDADTVCVGQIGEVFDENLEGCAVGVIEDCMGNRIRKDLMAKINSVTITRYFNSGVMLINVEQYCQQKILTKFIAAIEKYDEKLYFFDQDAFNIILNGKVKFLPEKYNWQVLNKPGNDICIVRFSGVRKPWYTNFNYYFFEEWRNSYKQTPWVDRHLKEKSDIRSSEYRYEADFYLHKGQWFNALKSYCTYIKSKIEKGD